MADARILKREAFCVEVFRFVVVFAIKVFLPDKLHHITDGRMYCQQRRSEWMGGFDLDLSRAPRVTWP